jgi:hypothetical protein
MGNNITVIGGNFVYNAQWGVRESSFLGITMIGIHSSTNGRSNVYNRSAVTWNGTGTGSTGWKEYLCLKDCGPGTAAGVIQPGVTAGWQTYWEYFRDVPTGLLTMMQTFQTLNAGSIKKWNNSTVWVSAGQLIL